MDRPLAVLPPAAPPPPLLTIPSTRAVALAPEAAGYCCDDDGCGRPRGLRWRVQRKEPGWLVGEQRQVGLPVPLGAAHGGLEVVHGFAMAAGLGV